MRNPLELGDKIYRNIAEYMTDKSLDYTNFIKDGDTLSEEEKTARILEVVKDNLPILWSLFLIKK